jgi:hypothetical protein
MSTPSTPDEVMAEILAASPRPQKVRNLQSMHEVCRALYEVGPRDFSLSNIGKLCETKGIMRARGLYNGAAEDYRRLVGAWAHLAGPMPPKLIDKEKPSEAYVSQIQDPVLRMLVKRDIAKLNRVTAELNVLKASKTIFVDRRPVLESAQPVLESALKRLEDSELRALRKALSAEFLKAKGWEETKLGEIVNESGRTVFDPGFATGLRKLLGEL